MATKKLKINFKMPTPTAAERLHAQQQKNRKAAGLPDPSEYKKKLDSMKKENYEEDDGPMSQEQLDEISAQLKASYVSGAKKQIKQSLPFTKKTDEYRDIAKNFIAKRQKGIARANEEVEQLDEMPESSMKTRDVHSHLKKAGWELARSKGGHDVYKHPKAKHSIPVPRHNQLKAPLIRGIMKASKVEEGVRLGGTGGRGNIYQYDRNPEPRDGSELENTPSHPKTELQKRLNTALTDLGNKLKKTDPKLKEDLGDVITVFKKGSNVKQKIRASSYGTFKHHGFRKEEKDPQEYDYEGDMAKSDLRSIIYNAKQLHEMLSDDTNLAEWCQSKITLAEDYLATVTNYMRSQMNEEVELDEMIRVKTNKPIGTRVADIGPGGKEYNVKTDKAWDDSKKKQPQGADFAAQRRKERLAKNGRMDEGTDEAPFNKPYNKDSGTTTDKSGAKHTPMSKARHLARQALSKTANKPVKEDADPCWKGYKMVGMKKKNGREVPNCVPGEGVPAMKKESATEPTEGEMKGKQDYSRKAQIVMNAAKGKKSDNPDKFQKDPELSSEIHKT